MSSPPAPATPPPPPPPAASLSAVTENPRTIARHARIGMTLFAVYVAVYAGFVLLAAFDFERMRTNVGGVNLAVVYGFGLIVAAFVLALLYMVLCKASDRGRGAGGWRDAGPGAGGAGGAGAGGRA